MFYRNGNSSIPCKHCKSYTIISKKFFQIFSISSHSRNMMFQHIFQSFIKLCFITFNNTFICTSMSL